jgi:prepilin-type N-terminal cleavage/methylation domain-containing protein
MHTLARHPAREARLNRQAGNRAFTLIELLTVIAIIAILAAITFGVVRGVNERAAIGQAKAELASLAQALESYKMQYGDYPRSDGANVANATTASTTDGPGVLFNALIGKLGPYNVGTSSAATINGRSVVDLSRFSLQSATALPATPSTATLVANAFIDPWGRRYLYYYKTGTPAQWTKNPGYILLSVGPSVASTGVAGITVSVDGTYIVADPANEADNIYANK